MGAKKVAADSGISFAEQFTVFEDGTIMAMPDTTYQSVSDMIVDLTDDVELHAAVQEALDRQAIMRHLMARRAALDLSQADIAAKMGCSQSRVSKLETSADDSLRFGDLRRYAEAVGCELRSTLYPATLTATDEANQLANSVHQCLARLAELANEGDEEIAEGVATFFAETFLNFSAIVGRAAESLPSRADGAKRMKFHVELRQFAETPTSADDPSPSRQPVF